MQTYLKWAALAIGGLVVLIWLSEASEMVRGFIVVCGAMGFGFYDLTKRLEATEKRLRHEIDRANSQLYLIEQSATRIESNTVDATGRGLGDRMRTMFSAPGDGQR